MKKTITAVIADDEPLLRYHLQKMLSELWFDLDIVAVCGDGQQAFEAIQHYQPDIIFLDIQMPELSGMDLATKLQNATKTPLIVFVTAYDDFAVKAFENNAIDYVLKPINETRLAATCQKLQQRLTLYQESNNLPVLNDKTILSDLLNQITRLSASSKPEYLSWIKAYAGEDLHLISLDSILYFKAEDKYVSVYTEQNNQIAEYIIRSSLKELQQKINPENFWQIHRSTIVNVAKIDKVKKDLFGHLYVHIANVKLAVSRNAKGLFKGM